ncbi:MAG: SGNH/GDSL hydrolase family protein [Lachnospiraceae bacterium]|nr:SGNH/GDSL hydrolase family protein [Lachnospiraceae bacterium]
MGKRRVNMLVCAGVCAVMLCGGLSGCGSAATDDEVNQEQDEATEKTLDETADVQESVDNMSEKNDDSDGKSEAVQEDVSAEDPVDEPVSLEGLGISILGDSISTYDGWIPEGFNVFYPLDGELTDVSQTWWKSLIDDTGMELCANNSSSGSTCSGDSLSIDDPMFGCSDGRLSFLAGSQGRLPDVIVIYMGTNDLLKGVPIGDNDGTKLVEEGNVENFSDAYCLMLDKLASYYPTAQIFCCTLAPVGDWGTDQPFVIFENHLGLTAEEYSNQIKVIADSKGATVIDLYHCGITIDNLAEMTTDGVHLTLVGMECVKEKVLVALQGTL